MSGAGDVYYTTNPVSCEHGNTTNVGAVAADCTNSGFTAGVYCDDCATYISGHEVVAATGHNYESVVTEPTATEQGYTTYTCSSCGHSYVGDYTEALGQTYTVTFVVPSGVEKVNAMSCGKNGIVLPEADAPSGEYSYKFTGWVKASVESITEKPEIFTGSQVTSMLPVHGPYFEYQVCKLLPTGNALSNFSTYTLRYRAVLLY